jgi:uncharacterized protein YxjI
MSTTFAQNAFVVKEHLGVFKAANNFDLLDPGTGRIVLMAREEKLGILTKILRFTDFKRHTPFELIVRDPAGAPVLTVKRGVSILRSEVEVHDGAGKLLGTFRQKLLSIGGAFDILEPSGRVVASLKGKWTGWDFRFISGNAELAHVTKKWAGIGRELLTSADSYVLEIQASVPAEGPARPLIVAAVLCIDMVLKE